MTLYGAWSAEPRVRHLPLPAWAAKTTRLRPPPFTSADISTVPVAPAASALRVSVGLAAGPASGFVARSTTDDSAGTVTVIFPSTACTAPEPPYSVRKSLASAGMVTVFAVSALLTATRYSMEPVRALASVREKAYTESLAYRSVWTPSRSAGCSLVSFDSAAIDR